MPYKLNPITGKFDYYEPSTMTAHAFGGALHTASTLAQVNSRISNANLDASTATRTPKAHGASAHTGTLGSHANLSGIQGGAVGEYSHLTDAELELLTSISVNSEPTGFPLLGSDVTIAFSDAGPDRTFSITPTGASFDYYIAGVKYTKTTPQTVQITDTEGLWWIYFDGGTLTANQTLPSDIFWGKAAAGIIYWDATNKEHILCGLETHGTRMSGATHKLIHQTIGAMWEHGLAPDSLVTGGDGDTASHAQIGVAIGEFHDEDIGIDISALGSTDDKTVLYRDGAAGNWRRKTPDAYPVIPAAAGSNRLAYNEWTGAAWQQTEVANNQYVLCHAFATNCVTSNNIVFIQGQASYGNIPAARAGAQTELNSISLAGLPGPEFVPLFTLLFLTQTGMANAVKGATRNVDGAGGEFIDWRTSSAGGVVGVTTTTTFLDKEFLPIEWAEDGISPPADAELITAGTNGNVRVRKFDSGSVEDVTFLWDVPDDIVLSSGIKFKVKGIITEATGPAADEGVNFKLSGYSSGDGDDLDGTFGDEVEISYVDLNGGGVTAQDDQFITDYSGQVTITNLAAGETVLLHFERDTADDDDDYGQDIGVFGISIQYTRTLTSS